MYKTNEIKPFLDEFNSIDELPPEIAKTIHQHQTDDTIHGLLVIPPQFRAIRRMVGLILRWRKTPQRALAFGSDTIVIVETDALGEQTTIVIPIDSLLHIDMETFLLFAQMMLTWVDGDTIKTMTIEYSMVNERRITRETDQVRASIAGRAHIPPLKEDGEAVRRAAALPMKFRFYLRNSLLLDEHLQVIVFQPAMIAIQHWYKKAVVPNRTIALTDQCLILLEENKDRLTRYGINTYCYPLAHIQGMNISVSGDTASLSLRVGTPQVHQEISIAIPPAEVEVIQTAFARVMPAAV